MLFKKTYIKIFYLIIFLLSIIISTIIIVQINKNINKHSKMVMVFVNNINIEDIVNSNYMKLGNIDLLKSRNYKDYNTSIISTISSIMTGEYGQINQSLIHPLYNHHLDNLFKYQKDKNKEIILITDTDFYDVEVASIFCPIVKYDIGEVKDCMINKGPDVIYSTNSEKMELDIYNNHIHDITELSLQNYTTIMKKYKNNYIIYLYIKRFSDYISKKNIIDYKNDLQELDNLYSFINSRSRYNFMINVDTKYYISNLDSDVKFNISTKDIFKILKEDCYNKIKPLFNIEFKKSITDDHVHYVCQSEYNLEERFIELFNNIMNIKWQVISTNDVNIVHHSDINKIVYTSDINSFLKKI